MNWFPLNNYTHYSLLKGFSKPKELAKICKDNEYPACGITDYKTISGCVSFYKACKDAGVKPILGCSFDGYNLYAKNKDGWHNLIEIISSIDDNNNVDESLVKNILAKNNLIRLSHDVDIPISFYCYKEQSSLHRILLCSELKTTLPNLNKKIKKNEISISENNYIIKGKSSRLLEDIYNQCEDYDILNKPMLPRFNCPNNLSEEEYLKELCRKGWKSLLIDNGKVSDEINKQKYLDRFKEEFDVIKNANLFGYFLIVQDIIKYVNDNKWLSGPGRGSAAGCLISYLIGITQIDPIEFDLLFARFYNAGRNTEDHISLPDIDMDVPANHRDDVIHYLKSKYGNEKVSQMITFGRLQGRSAIKEVLRVNEACSFAEMNTITKLIPNEAEISDQLAEMDDDDRSIIRWALINNANNLKDFCRINDDGSLDGDYAEYFEQAIKLEGTFKTQGKHAAGIVISKEPLNRVCPMVKQKGSDEKIAGLEMTDLEALGHVKFDVLGLSLLDKIMKIKDLSNV